MSERLEKKLSEIEALLAKVTPGQWWLCDGDQSDPLIVAAPHGVTDLRGAKVVLGYALGDGDSEPHYIVEDADARLMAVAPAYIAWLVAQLREAIPSKPTDAMIAAALEVADGFERDMSPTDFFAKHQVERMLTAALYALIHDGQCLCRSERNETCEVCASSPSWIPEESNP